MNNPNLSKITVNTFINHIEIQIQKSMNFQLYFVATSDDFEFSSYLSDIPLFLQNSNRNNILYFIPFFITGIYNFTLFYNDRPIVHLIAQFDQPFFLNNYSSLMCYGSNFRSRICNASNIFFINKNPTFVFPFRWKFKKMFINSGSRYYPYDIIESRYSNQTIHILSSFPSNYITINEQTLITTRPYNIRMLFHNIVDFVIPLYTTITSFQNQIFNFDFNYSNDSILSHPLFGYINQTFSIYLWDQHSDKYNLFYAKYLSLKPIEFISTQPIYFKNAILGLLKTEKEHSNKSSSSINRMYEFDSLALHGFREYFLEHIQKNQTFIKEKVKKSPIITIIQRKTDKEERRIININEVENATKEECPFCKVNVVDLQKYNKNQQVLLIAQTSLLIGVHGSALAHLVWMHPTDSLHHTGVIEILPYMYTCRNWYQKLANGFGVWYSALNTKNISQSRWDSFHNITKVKKCHANTSSCYSGSCNEFLKSQSVIINISDYKEVLRPFITKFMED